MRFNTLRRLIALLSLFLFLFVGSSSVGAPQPTALPNPIVFLTSTEPFSTGGKNLIRYKYDVLNKDAYPADFFAPAPQLSPCGNNTKASRTWVDFYDHKGKRLHGFCALKTPTDLGTIWFALEEGTIAPSWVYVELNDRQTNTRYKSNLAETSL